MKEVNVHKHTKSCKRGKNPCRFSFPKLPSDRTLIFNPISEEEFREEAYNLICNPQSEEESSKQIYNLTNNPISREDLCQEIYKEKLDEARNILQTAKKKLSNMSEKELEKGSIWLAKEIYKKKLKIEKNNENHMGSHKVSIYLTDGYEEFPKFHRK